LTRRRRFPIDRGRNSRRKVRVGGRRAGRRRTGTHGARAGRRNSGPARRRRVGAGTAVGAAGGAPRRFSGAGSAIAWGSRLILLKLVTAIRAGPCLRSLEVRRRGKPFPSASRLVGHDEVPTFRGGVRSTEGFLERRRGSSPRMPETPASKRKTPRGASAFGPMKIPIPLRTGHEHSTVPSRPYRFRGGPREGRPHPFPAGKR